MRGDEDDELPSRDVLDVLDAMAAHAIEARALALVLAPDGDGTLRTLCDGLLLEIGRRIAAELQRTPREPGLPA